MFIKYIYERINAMENRRAGGHVGWRLGNGKSDLKFEKKVKKVVYLPKNQICSFI